MIEKPRRSLAKTISWRIIATLITIGGIFVVSGDIAASASVGISLNLVKMGFYYFHERLWNKIRWGIVARPVQLDTNLSNIQKA